MLRIVLKIAGIVVGIIGAALTAIQLFPDAFPRQSRQFVGQYLPFLKTKEDIELDAVFSMAVLKRSIASVDAAIGPPLQIDGEWRRYQVSQCRFELRSVAGGVAALKLWATESCPVDTSKLLPMGGKQYDLRSVTVGSLSEQITEAYAVLSVSLHCGNACTLADVRVSQTPTELIVTYVPGGRDLMRLGFPNVAVGIVEYYENFHVMNDVRTWSNNGDKSALVFNDAAINCYAAGEKEKVEGALLELMGRAKVNFVVIGDIDYPACEQK